MTQVSIHSFKRRFNKQFEAKNNFRSKNYQLYLQVKINSKSKINYT